MTIDLEGRLVIIEQDVYEIEHHIHSHEKWLGVAALPSGETHIADRIGPGIIPFALLSGNDDFGNWLQVLGSSDTPIESGMTKVDAHDILVTTTNSTEVFFIQFVIGESAGIADLISAEDFTEVPYISATNNADSGVEPIINKRIATGTKVWARTICIGQNAKTINFYVGVHEYVR